MTCVLKCTDVCKAKQHGCAGECPALPWQPTPTPDPILEAVQASVRQQLAEIDRGRTGTGLTPVAASDLPPQALPPQGVVLVYWDEKGGRQVVRGWTAQQILTHREEYAAARVVEAVAAERARWVAALDEEMVSCHLGVFNDGDDPRAAINKLLAWAASVALDPAVSPEARALIDRATREERVRQRAARSAPPDIPYG